MGCPPRSDGPSRRARVRSPRTAPTVPRGAAGGTTSVPPPRMWPGLSRWLPAYGIGHGRRGAANHVFSDPAAGRLDGSGSSTGFVQWCRPPRLKQLPPAGLLSRSRSRPRDGLEHGAGPADGQHSPIGLMCRIYGAVRFQIRGGARPALVIVSTLSGRRRGRAANSAAPATAPRRRGRRGHHPGPGTPRPRTGYSAGCRHRSRCRSQTVQHFSGYRHRCSTLMCGRMAFSSM